MTKQSCEYISTSIYRKIYYMIMELPRTGDYYMQTIEEVNRLNNMIIQDGSNKELIQMSIINDIFSNVCNKLKNIDCSGDGCRKDIVIMSANVARELLKRGFNLIDIKPNKNDNDKSVFVFSYADRIYPVLHELRNQEKQNTQETNNSKTKNF